MSQGTKKHDVPQCRNYETYWGAAGPTWPARSMVMVLQGLLQRVLVLQDASPLAWSCQVSKNINPVGTDPELQRSKRSREPALQKVRLKTATDDCKGLFLFLFSREERKLNMEMEKGGGKFISCSFCTSLQNNAAVPEAQWGRWGELWCRQLPLI